MHFKMKASLIVDAYNLCVDVIQFESFGPIHQQRPSTVRKKARSLYLFFNFNRGFQINYDFRYANETHRLFTTSISDNGRSRNPKGQKGNLQRGTSRKNLILYLVSEKKSTHMRYH